MTRIRIRTAHVDPERVAEAIKPDNSAEMTTVASAAAGIVETSIEREHLGGLQATADDYVRNLIVAERVEDAARTETHTFTDTTDQRQ